MSASQNPISGNTSMLLLRLLYEKDMYGYEMIETLSDRSQNVFELKVGTLYPLLHGMTKSGYLEGYEMDINGKTRKYYRITPSGKKHLNQMLKEWKVYQEAVTSVIGGVCYEC